MVGRQGVDRDDGGLTDRDNEYIPETEEQSSINELTKNRMRMKRKDRERRGDCGDVWQRETARQRERECETATECDRETQSTKG